ncbi:MAG: glucosidase, partial [Chlamydiales bacterium]|nr:glucosidase [Chlamydiales bacterium]
RLFGLNSYEGNHGEDVKECYYHLDGTPTHSYMRYLYRYCHAEFPYQKLKEENQKRTTKESEYELIDTGVFHENRYFDIQIEYAKADPEDLCIRIEIYNASQEAAPLHLIPQLWFRNQWSWKEKEQPAPLIEGIEGKHLLLIADDTPMDPMPNLSFNYRLGKRYLYGPSGGKILFTDNQTRFLDREEEGVFYKDGFHRHIIQGENTVNPEKKGTKGCLHYIFENIKPQERIVLHFRLSDKALEDPLADVQKWICLRKEEADIFYASIHPASATEEEKMIQRQALAGITWNKQIYLFDVNLWLKGDNPSYPPPPSRNGIRNVHWHHLNSMRILIMPDKWEYPWFASWDHAFHCIAYALIDIEFAKEQLWLLLFDQFQHPNGQIPSYEWEFSDVNPPVQAWAALRLFKMQAEKKGEGDLFFLERCFHKLLINFAWWVNKVDSEGNNVFEGGFLGMDNISVLDRSQRMSGGVKLQQSDGTGWMALFCLNLMQIALELSKQNKSYESLATKFFEHYVYIAHAMKMRGARDYELWSEKDGFFYDVLTYPDGRYDKFRVRSLVGIIPLYAMHLLEAHELDSFPEFKANFFWFMKNRSDLVSQSIIPIVQGDKTHYVLSLMSEKQLKSILRYIWDPQEFRSDFGFRSLSKYHM